jgi:hypothetical protein
MGTQKKLTILSLRLIRKIRDLMMRVKEERERERERAWMSSRKEPVSQRWWEIFWNEECVCTEEH